MLPVPTWIVAGPAGCGKSTLIADREARRPPGGLVALRVEASGLGEGALADQERSDPTGCTCCGSGFALRASLLVHVRRQLEAGAPRPGLVLEVGGTARLPDLVRQVVSDRRLQPYLGLRGIVAVLAADGAGRDLAGEPGLRLADAIVVMRDDLVPAADLARIAARLRAINPRAVMLVGRAAAAAHPGLIEA